MISTGGFVRKTVCKNASSLTVGGSDTALFIPQACDNCNRQWYKKGTSALYSFLLVPDANDSDGLMLASLSFYVSLVPCFKDNKVPINTYRARFVSLFFFLLLAILVRFLWNDFLLRTHFY